jgi:hypothetical protein
MNIDFQSFIIQNFTLAKSVPRTVSCAPRGNRNVVPLSIVTVEPYGISVSPEASYGLSKRVKRILPARLGKIVAWQSQYGKKMITRCNDAMHYLEWPRALIYKSSIKQSSDRYIV